MILATPLAHGSIFVTLWSRYSMQNLDTSVLMMLGAELALRAAALPPVAVHFCRQPTLFPYLQYRQLLVVYWSQVGFFFHSFTDWLLWGLFSPILDVCRVVVDWPGWLLVIRLVTLVGQCLQEQDLGKHHGLVPVSTRASKKGLWASRLRFWNGGSLETPGGGSSLKDMLLQVGIFILGFVNWSDCWSRAKDLDLDWGRWLTQWVCREPVWSGLLVCHLSGYIPLYCIYYCK